MAINVNSVYRTVLAILNREQRGMLMPDQFNRLGKFAQFELLEKSFYDYNRLMIKSGFAKNYEYADLAGNIKEKIDALAKNASIVVAAGVGPLPADTYRIVNLYTSSRTIEVEPATPSEINYINSSVMTAPSASFPVYYQQGANVHVLPTSITSVNIDYIKVPSDPIWGFTGGGASAYVYAAGSSTDFELHQSETPYLIKRILSLAGVVVKDLTIVELSLQEEMNTFNKENAQ